MNKVDKINRLNKPLATTGTLKYGRGDVVFEANGEVAAFEIDYIGAIKGIKKLGAGWTIKIGKRKIIIFSMAESELTELLFTYVGELEIKSCKYVTWDEKLYHAKIVNLNQNDWKINYGEWGSDARKYEEAETEKVIIRRVRKSSI
tara:strand:+ start:10067 stop:10504 length:438 start_codon:yes stop_codon:yes gene_type:complete